MENIYVKLSQHRTLETERLILRPVTLEDAEAMFAYASGRVMEKSGMLFSHEEPYATMDKHQPDRIVTRVHYQISKEDFWKFS